MNAANNVVKKLGSFPAKKDFKYKEIRDRIEKILKAHSKKLNNDQKEILQNIMRWLS